MSMVRSSGGISRREPCKKCGNPVFLAERLNVDNHLYHRTCFRCARCTNQLSLANYYETEDGQYCCETCPDEETTVVSTKSIDITDYRQHLQDVLLKRSVSDEEKEQTLQIDQLNKNKASSISDIHTGEDQIVATPTTPFAKARNYFISSQLNIAVVGMAEDYSVGHNDKNSSADEDPPDLPNTEPPDIYDNKSLMDIDDKIVEIIDEHSVKDNRQDILTPTTVVDLETKLTEAETELTLGTSFETLAKQSTDDNRSDKIGDKLHKDIVNNIETDSNINISVKCNKHSISDISHTDNNESLAKAAAAAASAAVAVAAAEADADDSVTILDDRTNTEFVTKDAEANNTVTIINNDEHDSAKFQQQQHPSPSLVQLRKQQFESNTNDIATMVTKIDSELPVELTPQSNVEEDAKNITSLEVDTSKLSPDIDVDHVQVANVRSQNSNSDEQLDNSNNHTNSSILSDKGIKNINLISTSSDQSKEFTIDKDKTPSEAEADYPIELNPFGDDDTDENDAEGTASFQQQSAYTPMKSSEQLDSTNPFGSTDDDDEEPVVPLRKHSTPLKKLSPASPAVNLNPFGDDDSSNDDEQYVHAAVNVRPVPKPRSIHTDQTRTPEPTPRLYKQDFSRNNTLRGSGSSLDSTFSGKSSQTPTGTYRKKKPAPQPPTAKDIFLSPEHKTSPSPRTSTTPIGKIRKNRPAPPPPTTPVSPTNQQTTSTSSSVINNQNLEHVDITTSEAAQQPQEFNTIEAQNMILISQLSPTKSTNSSTSELEKEKNSKDEKNRNRQSAIISSASSVKTIASSTSSDGDISSMQILPPNKSTYGKWKRKKGPAPPRPLPQRRQINVLSADELRCQLDIIEIQQQGLEKQGVKLEQLIRDKCEGPGVEEDSAISPEVEDLVLQLFELVNEKNELFRKQAELMYLRRQQRLEEEHADLEYQIRCLMERPERNKTDYDKAREEELINRLIEVVERRNEIVECLEMDRLREAEEDESINMHLNRLAAKREEDKQSTASSQDSGQVKLSKKEKKKQKKIKKTGKGVTIDVDKDVDETEIAGKEKKKKKWLF